MNAKLEAIGYKTEWENVVVNRYEGYVSNMSDYHMHEYYEISLIKTGNVTVILPNQTVRSNEPEILLMHPQLPHYIFCKPDDELYSRINVLFDANFISDFLTIRPEILDVFHANGNVLKLSETDCETLEKAIVFLEKEKDLYRKKLCLLYFLSVLCDYDNTQKTPRTKNIPLYVTKALAYVGSNYSKKILAEDLAWELGISRTTLLTNFKKYAGSTFYDYVTQCRLKYAIRFLKSGESEESTAEKCGFGSSGNLIRAFKRYFSSTPKQYLKNAQKR